MSDQQQEPKVVHIPDFVVTSNTLLKIELENGIRFNIQLVPVRVSETDHKTPDGVMPMYHIQFQTIVDQLPPDNDKLAAVLKGKG